MVSTKGMVYPRSFDRSDFNETLDFQSELRMSEAEGLLRPATVIPAKAGIQARELETEILLTEGVAG